MLPYYTLHKTYMALVAPGHDLYIGWLNSCKIYDYDMLNTVSSFLSASFSFYSCFYLYREQCMYSRLLGTSFNFFRRVFQPFRRGGWRKVGRKIGKYFFSVSAPKISRLYLYNNNLEVCFCCLYSVVFYRGKK